MQRVMGFLPWDTNPLYAVLHESIYCQGQASNWAAESIRKELFEKDFDAINAEEEGREVLFTGELKKNDWHSKNLQISDSNIEMTFPLQLV